MVYPSKWDIYAKGATTTADERNVQSPVFFFIFGNFYTAAYEEASKMKYYYTGYSCCGWIPDPDGGGEWRYFATVEEYKEAYAEALCP